jgi:hypothetical protein
MQPLAEMLRSTPIWRVWPSSNAATSGSVACQRSSVRAPLGEAAVRGRALCVSSIGDSSLVEHDPPGRVLCLLSSASSLPGEFRALRRHRPAERGAAGFRSTGHPEDYRRAG